MEFHIPLRAAHNNCIVNLGHSEIGRCRGLIWIEECLLGLTPTVPRRKVSVDGRDNLDIVLAVEMHSSHTSCLEGCLTCSVFNNPFT